MSSHLKGRGGGGRILASKPQKSLTGDTPKAISRRAPAATGKENPTVAPSRRHSSAVPAVRRSTSSIPRGKSPNPSDLNPSASESLDIKALDSGIRVLERCQQGKLGKDVNLKLNLFRRSSLDVNLGKIGAKVRNDGVNPRVSAESAPKCTVEICKNKGSLVAESKTADLSNNIKAEEKGLGFIKVFETSSAQAVGKYPSELHEKLATLEGRVQRITSDIKRTKERLDVNNKQAEPKLILPDIRKKIAGFEKAISCMVDGDGTESDLSEIVKDSNLQDDSLTGQCSKGKELNLKELEARFFPHQKLLKSSMASKDGDYVSGIDANPIALEFLASLNTYQDDPKEDRKGLKSKSTAVREMGTECASSGTNFESMKMTSLQCDEEIALMGSEKRDDFNDQENKPGMMVFEEAEDSFKSQIFEIGRKSSTGGWFVSEGEAVLLTHNDGSCSYYDIANSEEKAEYLPPEGVPNNLWDDCWLIRANGADGCSGRFVVAASAGTSLESGFCSWDFYTQKVQAFRVQDGTSNSLPMSSSRMALVPVTNTRLSWSVSNTMPSAESQQWWYRPCGPLLLSTASGQKNVSAYDIRDGELMMKWDVSSPVVGMECSSPLQWRSRGKVIVAETEALTLWDVNSLTPQPLLSIASSGKSIRCLHLNNTDAEIGGGVRQRVRSSEVVGNDGVFCTQDSINVFDFRLPTGIGLRISRQGANGNSIFSCGDSIFLGITETRLRNSSCSCLQHYSLRKGKLIANYALPDSNSHSHHSSITQVWGNSNVVMGINGMGLFVFDTVHDEYMQSFNTDCGNNSEVKDRVGPDDLYCPTFDYLGSRALVISRDRPAMWRYLL